MLHDLVSQRPTSLEAKRRQSRASTKLVNPAAIEYDNGTVSIANRFALLTYKKNLPAKGVPKRWEEQEELTKWL